MGQQITQLSKDLVDKDAECAKKIAEKDKCLEEYKRVEMQRQCRMI